MQAIRPNVACAQGKTFRLLGSVILLIIIFTPGWAQTPGTKPRHEQGQPGEAPGVPGVGSTLRRLEGVTWNPVTGELTWVVSSGNKTAGVYQATGKNTYVIDTDSATMKFQGAARRFSRFEAEQLLGLMDVLSRYAVESTLWWEAGEGESIDDKDDPVARKANADKETAPRPKEPASASRHQTGK